MSKLKELQSFGQSFWLDNLGRGLIESGQLARWIREDGLRGVTSNPSIFEKSIGESHDYDRSLASLAQKAESAKALYEMLAVKDIQDAADILRPVYDQTEGLDGYVSLEVAPDLAHDTKGTLAEARRLFSTVGKQNLMIKVPATKEGVPAIETLISEGINVNVTLLFAVDAYEAVARAHLLGMEALAARGGDVRKVASVASFFVSRVDTAVDALLAAREKGGGTAAPDLASLKGKAAIANARKAYAIFQRLVQGPRFQALASRGARPQRLLWASTGTKNPAYRDVVYVEELIGKETVNTMPPATAEAFRDHGRLKEALDGREAEADAILGALAAAGISLKEVTSRLLDDGVRLFVEAFQKLLAGVERARVKSR